MFIPDLGSQIRIFSFHPGSWIRDPGSRGQKTLDPGYGSANPTVLFEIFLSRLMFLHQYVTRIPYFILLWEGSEERSIILSFNNPQVKSEYLIF